MPQLTPQDTFTRFVPAPAVSYCIHLWHDCKFDLKITPRRSTKLGDYRFDFRSKRHTITINHDLNKFGFLVTYLHEIAHLKTFNKYGHKVLPHGQEWKQEFQQLVKPILSTETFPENIFVALKKYISNPKASSCSDPFLTEAIRSFDKEKPETSLVHLNQGEKFYFQNRIFIKEELRRTRYVCQEVKTGKKYLIPKIAEVIKIV